MTFCLELHIQLELWFSPVLCQVLWIKVLSITFWLLFSSRPLLYPFVEGNRQHLSAHHWGSMVTRGFRESLPDPATHKKPQGSTDGSHSLCWPAEPLKSKFFTSKSLSPPVSVDRVMMFWGFRPGRQFKKKKKKWNISWLHNIIHNI